MKLVVLFRSSEVTFGDNDCIKTDFSDHFTGHKWKCITSALSKISQQGNSLRYIVISLNYNAPIGRLGSNCKSLYYELLTNFCLSSSARAKILHGRRLAVFSDLTDHRYKLSPIPSYSFLAILLPLGRSLDSRDSN